MWTNEKRPSECQGVRLHKVELRSQCAEILEVVDHHCHNCKSDVTPRLSVTSVHSRPPDCSRYVIVIPNKIRVSEDSDEDYIHGIRLMQLSIMAYNSPYGNQLE